MNGLLVCWATTGSHISSSIWVDGNAWIATVTELAKSPLCRWIPLALPLSHTHTHTHTGMPLLRPVIINGCQQLFTVRRRWQTTLQKRMESVKASQGLRGVCECECVCESECVCVSVACVTLLYLPQGRWLGSPGLGDLPHLKRFLES